MAHVKIYTAPFCPFCVRAKKLLKSKGQEFEEVSMDMGGPEMQALIKKTGMKTVPQIFINDQLIGGSSELAALDQKGELDGLLGS